ncbi:NADPH-dependent assimilatory sulfite reductase hemoprotein subunit [Halosquirtibacter xylanolyticus]|uniref:NADPH-dependent assimilatory sulfite reductase hemoprotein subunit n=1 Tax=Halosquirtibacter xylanolyticus TaxID=3374599 RepID=UPI00374793C5|nr:NADPH-dependent assimilatory sulfite reductase hemoprotein subunit [Prolixibacteraceae bacterium]
MTKTTIQLSDVERIKIESRYLKGTLNESLLNTLTGAIAEDDTQLSKFHGLYQQTDRDTDRERQRQKLEPDFSFLIRVRLPGGIATADQWLGIDKLSKSYANQTIKLTTRQAFQLHGVIKSNLKTTISSINNHLMDTIAACGDVNRNVMCNPHPHRSNIHDELQNTAQAISDHLTPRTTAYHEIWLDKEMVADSKAEVEPIYGKTYLPRKFKIGIANPPYNDSDIFSQDLGYIAIEKSGKLEGFNIVVGGGMGSTFGREDTYPRLGDVIGFVTPDKAVDVAEHVVRIQKQHGNRSDRKRARFKYTIDNNKDGWIKAELEQALGFELETPRAFKFHKTGDTFGWQKVVNNKWFLTLFIEGGRVSDKEKNIQSTLRNIAELNICDFRLTGNQNLILGNINEDNKSLIEKSIRDAGFFPEQLSGIRMNSIACVALNTCSLAFSEAERYLPLLNDKIEAILQRLNLIDQEINIRMTGCPNGCGRPLLGEIGLIGKAPGQYNLYLGASHSGDRLSNLFKENLNESQILTELDIVLSDYASNRDKQETFGEFVIRKNWVKPIYHGKDFRH